MYNKFESEYGMLARIKQLTSRHIAKTLTLLENSNVPEDIRRSVKSEFWYLQQDIVTELIKNNVVKGDAS